METYEPVKKLKLNIKHTVESLEYDPDDGKIAKSSYNPEKYSAANNRTILHDLKPFNFSEEIKNQADVIYNKMRYQVHRGKIRDQLLFFCVYNAYGELGFPCDPDELGKEFKLDSGSIQRTDSLFSELQTGYRPLWKLKPSALNRIPFYCVKLGLSTEISDEIVKFADRIMQKQPSIKLGSTQTVAAGFLKYFMMTNGIVVDDINKIVEVTGRSHVTIDSICRNIATADNS